jgi:hypothetical protein
MEPDRRQGKREDELTRRQFLQTAKKWSKIVIAGALAGTALAAPEEAQAAGSWINSRGGGGWYNRYAGGGWYNRYAGGGWFNAYGGGWLYTFPGAWVNHYGGWVNRRGSWLNYY